MTANILLEKIFNGWNTCSRKRLTRCVGQATKVISVCPTNWTSRVGTGMWASASLTSSTPTLAWSFPKGMLWTPQKVFQWQLGKEDFLQRTIRFSLSHPCLGRSLRDPYNSPLYWHEQLKDQPQAQEAVRVPVIVFAIKIGTIFSWRTTLFVESLFLWSTSPAGPWFFVSVALNL